METNLDKMMNENGEKSPVNIFKPNIKKRRKSQPY